MRVMTLPNDLPPMPLKRYLSRAFPAMKDWALRSLLKQRDVRINGIKCGADAQVQGGDTLTIYAPETTLCGETRVIAMDDDLIALEKPAGIPVDADGMGISGDTMLARFQAIDPQTQLCHRLDTGTGGVLIAARHEAALHHITALFRQHDLIKEYECVVSGTPSPGQVKLTHFLVKDAAAATVRVLDRPAPGALTAKLIYAVRRTQPPLSTLHIDLLTGRTHQIRAQLSHVGLPVLGDDKYGSRPMNRLYGADHPLLWCTRIQLDGCDLRSEPQFPPISAQKRLP